MPATSVCVFCGLPTEPLQLDPWGFCARDACRAATAAVTAFTLAQRARLSPTTGTILALAAFAFGSVGGFPWPEVMHAAGAPAAGAAGRPAGARGTTSELGRACELLGINPTTERTEAKRAYHVAARAAHPDCGGSTELMQRVNEAWDTVEKLRGWV